MKESCHQTVKVLEMSHPGMGSSGTGVEIGAGCHSTDHPLVPGIPGHQPAQTFSPLCTDWLVRSHLWVLQTRGKVDSPQSACEGCNRPNRPTQGLSLKELCDFRQITEPLCACFFKCKIKFIRAPVFRVVMHEKDFYPLKGFWCI